MASTNFLESLPRIRSQVLENSSVLYKELSKELSENEKFTTTLTYDSSFLSTVQNLIEKSIQLAYSPGTMEKLVIQRDSKKNNENVKPINKNTQSQITFVNKKNDQYLMPKEIKNMDKRFSYMNSQINTLPKDNKFIQPQISVSPPPPPLNHQHNNYEMVRN